MNLSLNLKDKINEDLKLAFKSGEDGVVSALRFLLSVVKNKELEKRARLSKEGKPAAELAELSKLSDEETVNAILGEIKKGEKAIVQYEKGGRPDLVLKVKSEIEILKKYLPNA